jgi:pantetheine-phosphate adenylyltransferase
VAVARNINKRPLFSFEERVEMIRGVFAHDARVRVAPLPEGLLVEFAQSLGARALLRGLRGAADLEYEQQLASMNRALAPEVESVFLMSSEQHRFVSSSLVRDVALNGGDVRSFVPPGVSESLTARLVSLRGGG